MSTREEMIAHDRTVEEIAAEIGADSLAYLSLDGVYEAVGTPREVHCDACFTGDYPLADDGSPTASSRSRACPSSRAPAERRRGRTLRRADVDHRRVNEAELTEVAAAATSGTPPSGRGSSRRSRPPSPAATCSW